jgi:glycosyltransferase involved in cell wall biosynthesis
MMKILMIAPEPFFESRGTPFSEFFRIKALCHLGHQVDLVTYPIGENVEIRGLRIFRGLKLPFVKSVKTGPSFKKLVLDFFLFFRVAGRLIRKRYDLIHTHEEANIMGVIYSKLFRTPHLYDMHSSLVQQMSNFKFTKSKFITGIFRFIEKRSLRNARAVIVICRSLFDYAGGITNPQKLVMIENFIDNTPEEFDPDTLSKVREEIQGKGKKTVIYTGTLETYQGLSLLIDCMKHLDQEFQLVLIGGKEYQIKELREQIRQDNLESRVRLLGKKPPEMIPYYLKASDVLASPRILGTNIPLKIYSYLKCGVPVVATDLYTHTQTLTPDIAILARPEAADFARGIKAAVSQEGRRVSENARKFCAENYTFSRYQELVKKSVEKATAKKRQINVK